MRNTRLCLIIALILSFICGAIHADYDLGQPVPLDTHPVTAGSTGWFQSNPVIASSGSIYLAVWVDMRDAGRASDLYAARIAADGTILDPVGIRLTTNASVSGKPDVCWNGESFFVVYADNTGVVGTRILGIRVSPDAAILDENPILVANPALAPNPRVSWDGTNHLVVCQGRPSCPPDKVCIELLDGILVYRLSRAGIWADSMAIQVCPGLSTSDPVIASSPGGQTLVLWADDRNAATTSTDVYGAVLENGQITADDIEVSTDIGVQDQPDCCWTGTDFKVVWANSNQAQGGIYGRSVGTDGSLLDPAPWTVSSVTEKQSDPQIAWNGANCLVTWTRKGQTLGQFDIYGGRLNAAGSALDGSGVAICAADGRQIKSAVASLGDSFLTCWMDSGSGAGATVPNFGYQVRGIRGSSTATPVGAEFPLTQSAPQHKASCSAYNGQVFLVCWEDWRDGERYLLGELIDAYTGAPVTTTPFVISPLEVENAHPAAAWNGRDFVVTWLADKKVMARRVDPTGRINHVPFVVYDGGTTPIYNAPAIASDGNYCLITFRAGTSIHGVLMSREGTIYRDNVVGQSTSNAVYESTAVCWTGQCYIVAWKQQLKGSIPTTPGGIDYTTVSMDGTPSTVRRITDTTFPDYFKLACSGENVLLVAYGPEIRTRRLSLDGTLLDATPFTIPGSIDADCVSAAWNGLEYVLTWLSSKPSMTSAHSWQDDMQFATVNHSNQLASFGVLPVTNTVLSDVGASMCAGPTGRVFMAFSSLEGTPYQSTRIKALYMDTLLSLNTFSRTQDLYEGARVDFGHEDFPTGVMVSALFDDRFYVQWGRRGIGVTASPTIVGSGYGVSLTGELKNLDGEPVIEASSVEVVSSGNTLPQPVGMISRNLGGVGSNALFSTVQNPCGPYNVGLLVKVFGQVTEVGGDFFYVDDGSRVRDDSGIMGVKVLFEGGGIPALGSRVQVTGISASFESGTKIHRLIRAVEWSPIAGSALPPSAPVAMAGSPSDIGTGPGGGILVAWNTPPDVRASDVVEFHVWRDSAAAAPVMAVDPTGSPYQYLAGTFDRSAVDGTGARMIEYKHATAGSQLDVVEAVIPGILVGVQHRYWVSCLYRRVGPEGTSYEETAPQPAGLATHLSVPLPISPIGTEIWLSDVRFCWNGVTGANQYRIEVSTSPAFERDQTWCTDVSTLSSSPCLTVNSLDYTSSALEGTQPGTTLFWRVGARNGADSPGPVPAGPSPRLSGVKNTRFIYSDPVTCTISYMPPPP